MQTKHWTTQDLEMLPANEWERYEIINGELYVSKAPHSNHQIVSGQIYVLLKTWSRQAVSGKAIFTPGVIFSNDDNVIPDVMWISDTRLAIPLDEGGHFQIAPDLVIEVLSPGNENENRDREVKRELYSRQNVLEYWVIDWQNKQVEVYRPDPAIQALELVATLGEGDSLQSPLLHGFNCQIIDIFEDMIK